MYFNNSSKYCGNPKLVTGRTLLRKLTLDDAQDMYKYASNPEISKHLTWNEHRSIFQTQQFIKGIIYRYKTDNAGEWGIQFKDNGKLIGTIGFAGLDINNSCASIGYVLSKPYWGKGIMTEVVKKVIKFGFDEMKLNRIEAIHMVENEASGKVMKKSGMTYEGLLREKICSKGIYKDVKQYAIIKKDYINT